MTGGCVVAAAPDGAALCYEHADILNLLPHRGCMLMLRRLSVHGPHNFTGQACWSQDDPFVRGHGSAVVPATLLVEAAAQAAGAGLLAVDEDTSTPSRLGLLAGVRRCVFDRPAQAGRPVLLHVVTRRITPALAHATVEVEQDKARVASLQLLLAMPDGP